LGTPKLMTVSSSLLAVNDVHVSYGAVRALKGVSLELNAGEVVALLGTNGAGKSTLLRTISGLMRPSRGHIHFGGQSIGGSSPLAIVRSGLAHCPEGRRVFGGLTVADNLRLGAATRSDAKGIEEDQERMLSLFPILRQRWRQLANTMSGGEQQLLALARALMSRPKLLLLDEPTLGVAPLLCKQIFASLGELKKQGTTMLVVEQNVGLALGLADRAYVLRTGEVVLSGDAAELQDGDKVAKAYLGGRA
jgi:branched-chain amino acid transport system ATP-binding protein